MTELAPTISVDTGGLPEDLYAFLQRRYQISTVPVNVLNACSDMKNYISTMSGSSHVRTALEGGRNQRGLYLTFLRALGTTDYIIALATILYYFDKERLSTFNERLLFRFVKESNMSQMEQQCFCNLCTLFIATASPASRISKVASVDLSKFIAHLPDEISRQRLLSFYTTTR